MQANKSTWLGIETTNAPQVIEQMTQKQSNRKPAQAAYQTAVHDCERCHAKPIDRQAALERKIQTMSSICRVLNTVGVIMFSLAIIYAVYAIVTLIEYGS